MVGIQKNGYTTSDTIIASFHEQRYLMAPHVHQFAELVYVLDGEFTVISPGKREKAKTGDIIINQPYQPHGYFTDEEKTVKFWMILFEGSLLTDFIKDGYSYSSYECPVFTPSEELRIFLRNKMIDTDEKRKKLTENELRHLKATLYPIFDEYVSSVKLIKPSEKIRSNAVAEAFRYLSEHYTENISLKDVASAIGYSTSCISHSIYEITGMNFRGVLNSMRVEHAKVLLMTTNTNIVLISVECGFGSERSFHRSFSAVTGMTPNEYKERYMREHPEKFNKR